ncbi:MAG TPA: Wadjet anti-phage system protein JetD domain-containing protein [Patescibacteria group bacterium]|nr:Wadjet anti-phage system protein JetD domain-containing protein [Patescibacteria group bacterium]
MKIEKYLLEHKRKTVTEKELIDVIGGEYDDIVNKVKQLLESNLLQPIPASNTNGRRPSLYNKYRILKPEQDYTLIIDQIKLLHPRFDHQAYFNNPELYLRHRTEIEDLSNFLWMDIEELKIPMSINERSLRIWGKEKLLKESYSILNNFIKLNALDLTMLNYYETPEPFIEYIHCKSPEMNVLIIENKDTWFTLRKVMLEQNNNILHGREYHVLLYGEGRKITRGKGKLEEYDSEMLAGSKNKYYYFGDLDYEGMSIFMDLVRTNENIELQLHSELYYLMLSESFNIKLPKSKDTNCKDFEEFITYLKHQAKTQIRDILNDGRYIPQEIINYQIFTKLLKGN